MALNWSPGFLSTCIFALFKLHVCDIKKKETIIMFVNVVKVCLLFMCFITLLLDPFSMAPQKALETIGRTLSQQYERWQPKV